jgi:hypothetical protein
MELLLILIMTLGGLFYVGYPIFTEEKMWIVAPARPLSRKEELLARKGRALSAIKEVEFDFHTGKLSPEDYSSLRSRYEGEVIEVMKLLDSLEKGGKRFKTGKGEGGKLICSSCGEEVPPKSRYCPACGTRFNDSSRTA